MRKTSHDGGDSTSITSGIENDIRKSAMKKKSSLKRKAPNFSHESDETVIEPLLQKDKEKTETNQSAKYFTKEKTDSIHEKDNDKAKLLNDNKVKTTTTTTAGFCGTTESLLSMKEYDVTNTTSGTVAPIHNYMNTNVFNTHENTKVSVTAKTQILVEIDGSKQVGYNPSPLIFTTAKIHTDAKTKQMEPVQVTPMPILSTIEVNMTKGGNFTTNEKKIANGSSVMSPVYSPMSFDRKTEEKGMISNLSTATLTSASNKDTFGKSIVTTSAVNLSNNTSALNSFKENSLPSTSYKTSSMTNNANNQYQKQETSQDIQNYQPLPTSSQLNSFNFEFTKSNGSVKTSKPSSAKVNVIDMSTKLIKTGQGDTPTDKDQLNKQVQKSDNKISINISNNDTLHFVSNIKSPVTSKSSIAITNPTKNIISNTSGIKQLQRQKTITDEKDIIESKTNTSSHSNLIDSTSTTDSDKLPQVSANDMQNIAPRLNFYTTASPNTIVTTKSSDTRVNLLSSTTNISCIPSTTHSNTGKIISPTKSVTGESSIIKIPKSSAVTTALTFTKSPATTIAKTSAIPMSISSVKSADFASASNTVLTQTPSLTISVANTTSVKYTDGKVPTMATTKPSPEVTAASILGNKAANLTNITAVTKSPSITTSTKVTSVSSLINTKPSLITSQAMNTKIPTTSLTSLGAVTKAPAVIKTTPGSTTSSKTTTAQNTTLAQAATNTKTSSANIATKIPSVPTSTKASAAKSSATTIKFPNNNSSSISATTKPSTMPVAKSIPQGTSSLKKTTVSSSATVASPSIVKSPQVTSPVTIKESTSAKKSTVAKAIPSTTKNPPVSVFQSVDGSKIPSSGTISTICSKASASAVSTGKATLAKTPSISTSTKMPLVTPASSITVSAVATKSASVNPTQISSNKLTGIATAPTHSSISIQRPLESNKKGDSKSIENNKDGKIS